MTDDLNIPAFLDRRTFKVGDLVHVIDRTAGGTIIDRNARITALELNVILPGLTTPRDMATLDIGYGCSTRCLIRA